MQLEMQDCSQSRWLLVVMGMLCTYHRCLDTELADFALKVKLSQQDVSVLPLLIH